MRILVVQTSHLGDLVLSTPLLRELRRIAPETSIDVVTTPAGGELYAARPAVDRVLVYDKRWRPSGARSGWRLVRHLLRTPYGVAIAAQRSARSGLMLLLSGAARRIGFRGAAGEWSYRERVTWKPARHAVRRYLALAEPLGGSSESADARPRLTVTPDAARRADRLLASAGIGPGTPILAVAPGALWATKRWTVEGFAAVLDGARKRGLSAVLLGSASERALCERVAALSEAGAPVLAGRTGILELAALLQRCRALVSNDSGPAHVAAAVGTPVAAVFGPTVPEFGYTPRGAATRIVQHEGLDCRPCDRHGPQVCPLGHFQCMRGIGPERVTAALDGLL